MASKSAGFSLRALKKYPELIPLVTIISGAVVMGTSFMAYGLYTKPDVRIRKSSELPPFERVQPTEPRKLRVSNKEVYQAIPELEQLKKEIGSYKY